MGAERRCGWKGQVVVWTLVTDGKGNIMLRKKRKNFRRIPYDDFVPSWKCGDPRGIWNCIQQLLSLKVLGLQSTYRASAVGTPEVLPIPSAGGFGAFTSWVTGDASTSSTAKVEQRLKTETLILVLPNETVQLAFQTGRDYLVVTTDRVI